MHDNSLQRSIIRSRCEQVTCLWYHTALYSSNRLRLAVVFCVHEEETKCNLIFQRDRLHNALYNHTLCYAMPGCYIVTIISSYVLSVLGLVSSYTIKIELCSVMHLYMTS